MPRTFVRHAQPCAFSPPPSPWKEPPSWRPSTHPPHLPLSKLHALDVVDVIHLCADVIDAKVVDVEAPVLRAVARRICGGWAPRTRECALASPRALAYHTHAPNQNTCMLTPCTCT
eukprot:72674-Chlamydomonas_euryale.AAC.3